jgi:hypothetical protein
VPLLPHHPDRPNIVDYGREVVERVNNITFVLETKKKDELTIKLLDDPKIFIARRSP